MLGNGSNILLFLLVVSIDKLSAFSLLKQSQSSSHTALHFLKPIRNWFSKEKVEKYPTIDANIVIIGAGASGLACALELLKKNVKDFVILESSDGPGGRIRTDNVDGFLLDRGFQVFIEGYPESLKILDYEKLSLKPFLPGALVKYRNAFYSVSDPLRRPEDLIATVTSPIGSFVDKLKVGVYTQAVKLQSVEDIFDKREVCTADYLTKELELSPSIIDRFFTPFYQGIFLSPLELQSSRMFEFVFKMFGESSASLPARGMGQVTSQMADRLPPNALWLNSRAVSLSLSPSDTTIRCQRRLSSAPVPVPTLAPTPVQPSTDKKQPETVSTVDLRARRVVLAVDPPALSSLLPPDIAPTPTIARSSTCLYYALDGPPPVRDSLLILNGEEDNKMNLDTDTDIDTDGPPSSSSPSTRVLVNNVCFPSQISSEYAPPGKTLASVTLVGPPPDDLSDAALDEIVRDRLASSWFPSTSSSTSLAEGVVPVDKWRLLKIYRIPFAQPSQSPPYDVPAASDFSRARLTFSPSNVYVCGDHRSSATLHGALESGRKAAQLLLKDMDMNLNLAQ